MKLIGTATSPYVCKVRIVLAEKKINYDFADSAVDEDSAAARSALLSKAQALLLLDDGTALFDARVIVEYLDNVAPNNKLYPVNNRERTECKRWEALSENIYAALLAAYATPAGSKNKRDSGLKEQLTRIGDALSFLDENFPGTNFCMGIHFSMVDIAVSCALHAAALRFPEQFRLENYTNLERLQGKLTARPTFAETFSFANQIWAQK